MRHSELVKNQVSNQKSSSMEEGRHPRGNTQHSYTRGRGRFRGDRHRGRGGGHNTQGGARGGAQGGGGFQAWYGKRCAKCGKAAHRDWNNCPTKRDTCHKCMKTGHWSRLCNSNDELTESMNSQFFLGSVTCADTENMKNILRDIGLLERDPVKIRLKDGAQPPCLTTSGRVPIPLLPKVTA